MGIEHASWVVEGTLRHGSEVFPNLRGHLEFNWSPCRARNKTIFLELVFHYSRSRKTPFGGWRFSGSTEDGLPIRVTRMHCVAERIGFMADSGNCCRTGFSGGELIIGRKRPAESLRFYFPDLAFSFLDAKSTSTRLSRNHTAFDSLSDPFSDIRVDCRSASDLVGGTGTDAEASDDCPTMVVTVRKKEQARISYSQVEELVRALEQSMGLATGLARHWVLCEGIKHGAPVFAHYRDAVHATGSKFPLVDPADPNDVKHLISQALWFLLQSGPKTSKAVIGLIRGLQLSSRQLSFPDSFLGLGAALEEFIAKEMHSPREHILGKTERDAAFMSFEQWASENLFPRIPDGGDSEALRKDLKRKFNIMLEGSLRKRVCALLDSMSLPFDEAWVADFVSTRNQAAHEGYSPTRRSRARIYLRMLALVHRYVLVRIGYVGGLVDWAISPPGGATISADGSVTRNTDRL